MKVVERKSAPLYEIVCDECGSKIQYKKSEVSLSHITCPVCGMSMWANTTRPVCYDEEEKSYDNGSGLFGKIETAIFEAFSKTLPNDEIEVCVTHDVYQKLAGYVKELSTLPMPSWLDFYRAYKSGRVVPVICGVKMRPAQWGTGWSIVEKPVIPAEDEKS